MARYVYPTASCAVGWQGGIVHLNRLQVWDGDDAFVKAHPECFSDQPATSVVHRTAPVAEQATAAPGEKRARRG